MMRSTPVLGNIVSVQSLIDGASTSNLRLFRNSSFEVTDPVEKKKLYQEGLNDFYGSPNGISIQPLFQFDSKNQLEWIVPEVVTGSKKNARKNLNEQLRSGNKPLHYVVDPNFPDRYWVLWSKPENSSTEYEGLYCQFTRIGNELRMDGRPPFPYEKIENERYGRRLIEPRFASMKQSSASLDPNNHQISHEKMMAENLFGILLNDLCPAQKDVDHLHVDFCNPSQGIPSFKNQEEIDRDFCLNQIILLFHQFGYFNHFIENKKYGLLAEYLSSDTPRITEIEDIIRNIFLNALNKKELQLFLDAAKDLRQNPLASITDAIDVIDALIFKDCKDPQKEKNFIQCIYEDVFKVKKQLSEQQNSRSGEISGETYKQLVEQASKLLKFLESPLYKTLLNNDEWKIIFDALAEIKTNSNQLKSVNESAAKDYLEFFSNVNAEIKKVYLQHIQGNSNFSDQYILSYLPAQYEGELVNVSKKDEDVSLAQINLLFDSPQQIPKLSTGDRNTIRTFILEDPVRRRQYAQVMAARFMLQDKGVNDFHVSMTKQDKYTGLNVMVVSGFDSPFEGICLNRPLVSPVGDWLKNQVVNQDSQLMHTEEMADEFLRIYYLYNSVKIQSEIQDQLDKQHSRFENDIDYPKKVEAFSQYIGYESNTPVQQFNSPELAKAIENGIKKNADYFYFTEGLPLKIAYLFSKKDFDISKIEDFVKNNQDALMQLLMSNNLDPEKSWLYARGKECIKKYCNNIAKTNSEDVVRILRTIMRDVQLGLDFTVKKIHDDSNHSDQTNQLESLIQRILGDQLECLDQPLLRKGLNRVHACALTMQSSPTHTAHQDLSCAVDELNQFGLMGNYFNKIYKNEAEAASFDSQNLFFLSDRPDEKTILIREENDVSNVKVIHRTPKNTFLNGDKGSPSEIDLDTVLKQELSDWMDDDGSEKKELKNGIDDDDPSSGSSQLKSTKIDLKSVDPKKSKSIITVKNEVVNEGDLVISKPFKHLDDDPVSSSLRKTAIVSSFQTQGQYCTTVSSLYIRNADILKSRDQRSYLPSKDTFAIAYLHIQNMLQLMDKSKKEKAFIISIDKDTLKKIPKKNLELYLKAFVLICNSMNIVFDLPREYRYLNDPRSWKDPDHYSMLSQKKFGVFKMTLKEHEKKIQQEKIKLNKKYFKLLKDSSKEFEADIGQVAVLNQTLDDRSSRRSRDSRNEVNHILHEAYIDLSKKQSLKPTVHWGKRIFASTLNIFKKLIVKKLNPQGIVDQHENTLNEKQFLYEKRRGGQVKFYSDSYTNQKKDDGAFNDIFNSMHDAKESILITGWTLSPTEKFKFTDSKGTSHEVTLPQLFARKAMEGVDVVLMIWKNIAPDFRNDTFSFMDEVKKEIKTLAAQLSQDSSSDYYLSNPEDIEKRFLEKIHARFTNTHLMYSDHAKMVITDSKTLFMGGLDLTVGRGNIKTWHDCHCRIEGSDVISDAIDLFYRRFKKDDKVKSKYQNGVDVIRKVKQKALENQQNLPAQKPGASQPSMHFLTSLRKEYVSIDDRNFSWEKDTHTKELLMSHVDAIKKAKNFIYMENQFFVGPRHSSVHGEMIGPNLIITELFNKIKSKIENGEPFHFYCQLPYRPEGKEDDIVVQSVLREQWKTMKWFMKGIQEAVYNYNLKNSTQMTVGDYITFSNLGFYDHTKKEENGFEMKYTHSKLTIIDDDTAFIGSNNCNERSSKGNRDHEICVRIENDPAIKKYREDLMSQHFGQDCMTRLDGMRPNDSLFYQGIQAQLNSNLSQLESKNSASKEVSSTPWGNIPTTDLEQLTKPPHVKNKTHTLIGALSSLVKPVRDLSR